jgi:hypothetical protein
MQGKFYTLESEAKIGEGEEDSSGLDDSSDDDDDSSPLSELVKGMCDAETWFNALTMCMKVLVAMCHRIFDKEGSPLLDIDACPWTKISRMKIHSNSDHYIAEVECWWKHLMYLSQLDEKESDIAPHPKAWKLSKLLDWLHDHPIIANADNDFLTKIVTILKQALRKPLRRFLRRFHLVVGNWVEKYLFLCFMQ